MKTIILPGFSPRNKEWAEDVKSELKLGHEVEVHQWRHWKKGGSLAMNYELAEIKKKIARGPVNIIAKSVGNRVAASLMPILAGQVEKVILCGIASVSDAAKKIFTQALSDFPPAKIVCFQNSRDPFVPYSEAVKFVHTINPKISVVEKPRSDHHYPYYEDFQEFLTG